MDWFKAYQDGILRGSLSEADDVTQLIWLKLLAIQNETRLRDGWLHYAVGRPMNHEYLAMVCHVTVDQLEAALGAFLGDVDRDGNPRIEIAPDGDIFLKNWERHQAKPDRVEKKQSAIDKAKETKRRQDSVVVAQTRLLNELQFAIGKLEGRVAIPVKCPFCATEGIKDKITLARHIDQAGDDEHMAGIGWARGFLKE